MKVFWYLLLWIFIFIISCLLVWVGLGVVEFVCVISCGDVVYMVLIFVRGDM